MIGAIATDAWTSRWLLAVIVAALGGALAVVLAALRVRAEAEAASAAAPDQRRAAPDQRAGRARRGRHRDVGRREIAYVNDAAVALLQAGSREELLNAPPGGVMSRFAVFDEDGRRSTASSCPATGCCTARARRRRCSCATSSSRPARSAGCSTRPRWCARRNQGDGVVNVIEDLTAIKRAELRERLLSEATAELSRSLDYESTLRVAEVAVPSLADWCSVSLPGAGQAVEVAIAHTDPEKVALGRRLRAPPRAHGRPPARGVLAASRKPLIQGPTARWRATPTAPSTSRCSAGSGSASILTVPLDAGGRRLGAMLLVRGDQSPVHAGRLGSPRSSRRARPPPHTRSSTPARRDRGHAAARDAAAAAAVDAGLVGRRARSPGRQPRVGGDFFDAFGWRTRWWSSATSPATRGRRR